MIEVRELLIKAVVNQPKELVNRREGNKSLDIDDEYIRKLLEQQKER
ncbi:hypothetical protein GCM10007978_32870 [Shewanella hanedai]|nr:hypothetical protein [Shewanella hanedai]GGI92749.1 hypothetical protein GCM10007978_32870 [Shewanella hanedai]